MDLSWKFKAARRFFFSYDQQIFHRKIYQNFGYHEHNYDVHDTWSFGKFCDEKFVEDVLTKAVKINKIY